MAAISTHVLDIASGRPAADVPVRLERRRDGEWALVGEHATDADGRVADLLQGQELEAAEYRITFDTDAYLENGFYPEATVTFRVAAPHEHHHVPLLLSPYGYSTYRGS